MAASKLRCETALYVALHIIFALHCCCQHAVGLYRPCFCLSMPTTCALHCPHSPFCAPCQHDSLINTCAVACVLHAAYGVKYITQEVQVDICNDETAYYGTYPISAVTTCCLCRGGSPVVHSCGQQHCAGGRCGVPAQAGGAGSGQGPW